MIQRRPRQLSGPITSAESSVLYGLASAASYGVADYLSQVAGRTVGVWRTSFYYYLLGLLALSCWLLAEPHALHLLQNAPLYGWLAGIASGLALLAAVVLFTQGLVSGDIAIVAPVTATYGGVTALLLFLNGQHFSAATVGGLALLVAGASIVSLQARPVSSGPRHSGLGWALAASLAYGIGFWLQGAFAVPALGPLLPVWLVYAIGLVVMGVLSLAGIVRLRPPERPLLLLPTLFASLFSIAGFLALTEGMATQQVAVVVALSSLTSAVTVCLSRIFAGTRLAWYQWGAIVLITAGLVLTRL